MHTEQKSMVARVMAVRDNRQTSPVHTNSKVQGEVQKENGFVNIVQNMTKGLSF